MDCHSEENTVVQPGCDVGANEAREIMEIIAGTGKFWHRWDFLKALLSDRLKQVWAEYTESPKETVSMSQESSTTEMDTDLAEKMNEALLSFTEGPPFTLQRLCEILLDPKSMYPKLSKLALALEKNLLVASTLDICTDRYPGSITKNLPEPDIANEEMHDQVIHNQNGASDTGEDMEEEMVDCLTGDDNMNIDDKIQADNIGGTTQSHVQSTESNPEVNPAKEDTAN